MYESRVETATGMCVIALTKYIMDLHHMNYEAAYKLLLTTELYKLLQDTDTNLYLEPNGYLFEALNAEFNFGKEALYEYINK